jgi:hypothetical protein
MTEQYKYIKEFRVDDIPKYDNLFIRDGEQVFVVNKHTGEISSTLSIAEYVKTWRTEWENNPTFRAYYQDKLTFPTDPDKAETLEELRRLCSDKTRLRRGDERFLLDFMLRDLLSTTEMKLFTHLTKCVEVWNYAVVDYSNIPSVLDVSERQVRNLWRGLQEKGMIAILNTQFHTPQGWRYLVKVHPMIFWEGRYSAWAAKCKAEYEYEDAITL